MEHVGRKKGSKAGLIPYAEVKAIIKGCKNKRTQALLAFQYATACRVGELAKEYEHKKTKLKKGDAPVWKRLVVKKTFISKGIRRRNFIKKSEGIEWDVPNFKNKGRKEKKAFVPKYERWLCNVIIRWLKARKGKKWLFALRQSRIRGLIDAELKKHNHEYATHWLRHSRATHLAELSRGNVFAIQDLLGHTDVRTATKYVSISKHAILDAFKGKNVEKILGERV